MADRIIDGFWQMTDLAIEDHQQNKQVEGIDDIEFWMHKLFNKVEWLHDEERISETVEQHGRPVLAGTLLFIDNKEK